MGCHGRIVAVFKALDFRNQSTTCRQFAESLEFRQAIVKGCQVNRRTRMVIRALDFRNYSPQQQFAASLKFMPTTSRTLLKVHRYTVVAAASRMTATSRRKSARSSSTTTTVAFHPIPRRPLSQDDCNGRRRFFGKATGCRFIESKTFSSDRDLLHKPRRFFDWN